MNSVVMETEKSVAANATNPNVLSGELYERAPFDGLLTLNGGITGSHIA